MEMTLQRLGITSIRSLFGSFVMLDWYFSAGRDDGIAAAILFT